MSADAAADICLCRQQPSVAPIVLYGPVLTGGSRILAWEGHWQDVWRTKVPSGVQGHSPDGI